MKHKYRFGLHIPTLEKRISRLVNTKDELTKEIIALKEMVEVTKRLQNQVQKQKPN